MASDSQPELPLAERSGDPVPFRLRHAVDLLVCLAIAVILFRFYQVEGYIISTGSMAPSLLGYHKHVRCPNCSYEFAYGVAYDESVTAHASEDTAANGQASDERAMCPNCGQRAIDLSHVPRSEGDQLLVRKHAFALREPRRYEVIVFRNPNKPTQAYVKRVVGLPGERLRIQGGDVWINGHVAAKTMPEQRAVRILVHNHDFTAARPDWQPRWTPAGHWRADGTAFVHEPAMDSHGELSISWLTYRNWIRSGGWHETRVKLAAWPENVALPVSPGVPLYYDEQQGELVLRGVMPDTVRDELLRADAPTEFHRRIADVAERSHIAPIDDSYGYNRFADVSEHNRVTDLMLACNVERASPGGLVVFEISYGRARFACEFNFDSRLAVLRRHPETRVLRRATLPDVFDAKSQIEISTFDRQLAVTVNEALLFEPLPIDDPPANEASPVIRIGAAGASLRIDGLRLFRDIYYTNGRARHGVESPLQLGPGEYFVLGDNSPVSFDSRSWKQAVVKRKQLLGKPFLVHLPSRAGRLRVGSYEGQVRIPDLARIRYIR